MQEFLKQEYIKMRNSGQFNMTLFWNMYQSEGGVLNKQEFAKHFLFSVQPLGGGMEIKEERDRDQILISVDKKLELNSLYNKEGQFIKIC